MSTQVREVPHDAGCKYARPADGGHSDAAKRISDTYNLHLIANRANARGRWIAVALSDGSTDHALYDSRRDAVAHQRHNEQFYAFIRIMPTSMSYCEAESLLYMYRLAYDNGFRMADPEAPAGGYDLIPRLTSEEFGSQIAALERGTWPVQRV